MDRKKSIPKKRTSASNQKSFKLDTDEKSGNEQRRESSSKQLKGAKKDSKTPTPVKQDEGDSKVNDKMLSNAKRNSAKVQEEEEEGADEVRKKEMRANNKKQLAKLIAEDEALTTGPESASDTEEEEEPRFYGDVDDERDQDQKEEKEVKIDSLDVELSEGYFQKEMDTLLAEYRRAVANIDDIGPYISGSFSELRGEIDNRFVANMSNRKMCYGPICEDGGINWRDFNENDEEQAQLFNGYLSPHDSLSFKKKAEKCRALEHLKKTAAKEEAFEEEMTLKEKKKKTFAEVSELRKKIARYKQKTIAEEFERIELINHLKTQLFQAQQQGERDVRYANNWYGASNSHLMAVLENEMTGESMKLKSVEIEMTRERLSHKNILCWYKLYFEEIKNKVSYWMNKYEVDISGLDEAISQSKETIKAQDTLIREFEGTIAVRMKELGPYEEEKERLKQERLENMRLFYMARKIQRWWRKYMKKHNLYKKKKKGNVSKDEKDKKKKKTKKK